MHAKRRESLIAFVMSFGATVFTLALCLRTPPLPIILIFLVLFSGVAGMAAARTFMTPDHYHRLEERRYRSLHRRMQPWLIPLGLAAVLLVLVIQIFGRK